MQNQVRKFVFAVSLVGALSMAAPAMAASRGDNAPHDFFSRIKSVIAHILDIVEVKGTIPPG
jgi:hypothetical protein